MWKEGDGLPHRGYYNGNVEMMIANGTFADFYPKLLATAKRGKYSFKGKFEDKVAASLRKLEEWEKEWNEIPVEERMKRRDKVVENGTPKNVIIQTVRGPMAFWKTEPENNDNLYRANDIQKKEVKRRLPSGAITRDDNPLIPLKVSPA